MGVPGMLNDAHHEYVGCESVAPGDTAVADIWFLMPEYQQGRLYPGFEFTVQEGSRVVGHGVIIAVLNEELRSGT
jgi:elongation factor Tu